ncbi:MAG TPA: DNA-directed RNA polymerase subunit beta, partial [Bacilli bacterium]|nr:DNA-directed RNA polymerase subunit beta [Bacilli bacterium]
MDVRDVHHTHYGRICPIETPEGQNIGLINNLATYAKINKYGFIETPYRRVDKKAHRVLEESEYLSADMERTHIIAQANVRLDDEGVILDDFVVARHDDRNIMARKEDVDYIDVSPKQIVSIASACIPFLENDDTTRALMGANMQRQALPLIKPTAPLVGTGMEHIVARDSGLAVISTGEGVVSYVDSRRIVVKDSKKKTKTYQLQKFARSNQGTCINQIAVVKVGQEVKTGDILADGPAMQNGDLALGQNVTIAFMTWNGYNYEDAVIMSERLVKDDSYTSIHIEKYECECRDTKLGAEEITRDVPNISEEAKAFLDERGIVVPGAEVKEGDILVGKITPKGVTEPTPEEKLLMAIFSEKTKEGKDTSLRVSHGGAGIVLDVKIFTRKNGDELPPGVNEVIRVYIVQRRKISEGDKMSGRHGNKGVISRILPVEDMPFLPDGTPVDIMLNPLGVPSRMNIGQILEIHLGLACKKLGLKLATPVFDGITNEEIFDLMKKAEIAPDGKTILYDGRTG